MRGTTIAYKYLNYKPRKMPELIPILPEESIAAMVAAIGRKMSLDYEGRNPILIGVLKGAFVFLSDLIRQMTIPVIIDFLQTSSYGSETTSCGAIRFVKEIGVNIKDQHVVLVEDIVDTGKTLSFLIDYLQGFCPASVKVCTLIDKQERREKEIEIDYACHCLSKGFVVGYGLDFNEKYRYLPGLYHLKY